MKNAHLCPRLTEKNIKRSNLQKEILPPWQSALKWGLGEVEPGSTPSGHTGGVAVQQVSYRATGLGAVLQMGPHKS